MSAVDVEACSTSGFGSRGVSSFDDDVMMLFFDWCIFTVHVVLVVASMNFEDFRRECMYLYCAK
jgi:hypothetical protein